MNLRVFFFLFFAFTSRLIVAQDLFSYDNSFRYAKYLFATKEYDDAIVELNRCLYLSKENENGDLLKMLLVSYRNTEQYGKTLKAAERSFPKIKFPVDIMNEVHYSFILDHDFKTGSSYLGQNIYEKQFDNLKFKSSYYVFENKIDSAYQTLYGYNAESSFEKTFIDKMNFLLIDANQEKYKSPLVAGLLSVVIPGMGKFYAKRKKDAIFSFVLTSATAYQSYRGFRANGSSSIIGWIYGAFATGFYIGNIYGSVKAAKNQNEFVNEKYHHQMLSILGL